MIFFDLLITRSIDIRVHRAGSQLKILPGNVCRKVLKFPENPGNPNVWTCNIILMTINEAYLVALSATVTSNYIPMMTPGLLDTFPGASWDISWVYWIISWAIFDRNIDILAQISSYIFWVSTVRLYVKLYVTLTHTQVSWTSWHVSWIYWSISLTSFDGYIDILPPDHWTNLG